MKIVSLAHKESLPLKSSHIPTFSKKEKNEKSLSTDNIEFVYHIINIVAMGIINLKNKPLDFTLLKEHVSTRSVNHFPCVLFKLDNVSVILFRNGKCIFTGIKTYSEIDSLKKRFEALLEESEIKYDDFTLEIQNIVVMTNLHRKINLELSCLLLTNCLYEPEQFPAAIIKPKEGGTFLVFSNSKIIALGLKNIYELEEKLIFLVRSLANHNLFIEHEEFFSFTNEEILFLKDIL